MGSAGVTSHVRGLKDPTDVLAADAGIFDDETPGRRLFDPGCSEMGKRECKAHPDQCKWKKNRKVCKPRRGRRLGDMEPEENSVWGDETPDRRLFDPGCSEMDKRECKAH